MILQVLKTQTAFGKYFFEKKKLLLFKNFFLPNNFEFFQRTRELTNISCLGPKISSERPYIYIHIKYIYYTNKIYICTYKYIDFKISEAAFPKINSANGNEED